VISRRCLLLIFPSQEMTLAMVLGILRCIAKTRTAKPDLNETSIDGLQGTRNRYAGQGLKRTINYSEVGWVRTYTEEHLFSRLLTDSCCKQVYVPRHKLRG
jgi:hypothetical protein